MKPEPWSHTSLSDFKTCPFAFHAKRVEKSVVEPPTEHMIWGTRVHSAFEHRILNDEQLPDELKEHEDYLKQLSELTGDSKTEQKIALNLRREPCEFFDKNVWFRGVIDFCNVSGNEALIVDYKTGKPHSNFNQLMLFAIHTFVSYPAVEHVVARYYWTKTKAQTEETYSREDIPDLWSVFIPDLRQYVEAFKTDTWQKRTSGLCRGWCPVTTCSNWSPRR